MRNIKLYILLKNFSTIFKMIKNDIYFIARKNDLFLFQSRNLNYLNLKLESLIFLKLKNK